MCDVLLRMRNALPWARGRTLFITGPGHTNTWSTYKASVFMLWLFSALAAALFSSFSMGSLAALGVFINMAAATPTSLPRIRSQTIFTLRGEMRTCFK